MINLNEEIALVLEESLGFEGLDEGPNTKRNRRKRKNRAKKRRAKKAAAKKAGKTDLDYDDWEDQKHAEEDRAEEDRTNRVTVKQNVAFSKIRDLLASDGEEINLSDDALLHILKVFVKGRQDLEDARASRAQDKTATKIVIVENYKRSWIYSQLAYHTKAPSDLKEYLAAGGDDEEAEYRSKKIAYIGKKLKFLPMYDLGDFELRTTPEETPEPGAGTDDEEETPTDTDRSAMSDADKEEVAKMLHKASEILAIRALNTKDPGALVNKYGRLLRKYFIVYRAPKAARARTTESKSKETGIIEEMFLVEEPATAAPAAPAASGRPDAIARAGRGGERGADALLDAMTDEIEVPLEMAKKSLGEIEKAYEKYIEVHKEKVDDDASYKARFMGMRYLMLRAAGREASGIKPEPSALQEGKLVNMVIDLEKLKSYQLDEGYLSMFGAWIEYFLNGLFGGWTPPVAVKGSQRDVEAFARALSGEKRYIETARRYGLDHPTTYKNKAKLDNAIKGFEGDTGIKWPFK